MQRANTAQKKRVSPNLIFKHLDNTDLYFISTVNKQINDKERVAAALENPNLKEMVDSCIRDEE